MMKQLLTLSLILISSLLITVPQALAEQPSTVPGKVKTLLNEGAAEVRQAVSSRLENFIRVIQREEVLLNKLGLRIDKARMGGQDVAELDKLMSDSTIKLSDAKTRLEILTTKKDEPLSVASFKQIRTDFKIVLQDVQTVKQNSAKIISKLKEFNRSLNTPVKNQATPFSIRQPKPS